MSHKAGIRHRHFYVTYFAHGELIRNKKYFTCLYYLRTNWLLCRIISLVQCCREKDIFFDLLMIRSKKGNKPNVFLACGKKKTKFWTARDSFKLQRTAKYLFKSKGFKINKQKRVSKYNFRSSYLIPTYYLFLKYFRNIFISWDLLHK